MKKLFSSLVMLTAFSICAFANDGKDDTEDHFDAQYVITDCGTVHKSQLTQQKRRHVIIKNNTQKRIAISI